MELIYWIAGIGMLLFLILLFSQMKGRPESEWVKLPMQIKEYTRLRQLASQLQQQGIRVRVELQRSPFKQLITNQLEADLYVHAEQLDEAEQKLGEITQIKAKQNGLP